MERNRMDLIKAIEKAVMHCERCSAYEAINGVEFSELYDFVEELKNKKKRFSFKSLPRLIDMLEPTAKAQKYCAKLIEQLKGEGYDTDAKIVNECLMTMQGEEVAMAVMDEDNSRFLPNDWITDGISTWKIKSVDVKYYTLTSLFGKEEKKPISDIDKSYHLWTYLDAKNGDYLYISTKHKALHAIFREADDKYIYFFCMQCGNFELGGEIPLSEIQVASPLIQSPHGNVLNLKLSEAGYRFDSSEKELKKLIRFKVGDWIADDTGIKLLVEEVNEKYNNYRCINEDFSQIITSGDGFHLFDVSHDAKNGNILVSDDNEPFIYNGTCQGDSVGAYCGFFCDGIHFSCDGSPNRWAAKTGLKPANVEQRAKLFSKMNELGLKFDFNKNILYRMLN